MPLATATVEFVPLRNDLANLPQSLAGMLFTANIPAQNAVVQLDPLDAPVSRGKTHDKIPPQPLFLGWTGLSSAKGNTIELDPTFASTLGIQHGQTVKISVTAQAPLAHTIHLEPVTSGDWEIMETHVAFLETYMINQVRAVSIGQNITVFPSPTALATLKVTAIEPPPPIVARISPDSEVIVAPKTNVTEPSGTEPGNDQSQQQQQPQQQISVIERVAAVYPYDLKLDSRDLEVVGCLPAQFKPNARVQVTLTVPPALETSVSAANSATASSPNQQSGGANGLANGNSQGPGSGPESEVSRSMSVYAKYVHSPDAPLGITYGLSNALGLVGDAALGAKVHIKSVPSLQFCSGITATLRPFVFQTNARLASTKNAELTSEQIESLGLKLVGRGLVLPPLEPFLPQGGILDTDSKEWGVPTKIKWGQETPLAESKRMKSLSALLKHSQEKRPVVGQDHLCDALVKSVVAGCGVLLYGSRGCGKTALINTVLTQLKKQHVKPIIFKCSTYTEKALPTVRDALKRASLEAHWASPSVVVFDDIDKLIPAQQEQNRDSARQQQIAETFEKIWRPLLAAGKVAILASAQDQSEVHSHLLSSHLIDITVHAKSPDRELREIILKTAIEVMGLKTAPSLDLIEVVGETEGYQPGDLWVLVERLASILALDLQNNKQDSGLVTTDSILLAAADYTPASLRGVKLERPNTKWEDVGGLMDTKRVVLETLDWPTKYAPIFANCPLRLRSGLLLYGYPGCGKTMLASAIASQTGLNFISVKGPEILNKYIGASEQSVRDLFDRAQAAKPCVLFFDEFDSIAPKRGHDATGVTDRVVNQLLTQMDGAEGLDGVYVLAATSRPDMIDSALLRPGRLDKSLLCGMPDTDDRYDIILRAAKKLQLAADVDLRTVAEKTANFSGADLQALVYNAYLGAVHDVLDRQEEAAASSANSNNSSSRQNNAFQIGPGDLEDARKYINEDSGNLDSDDVGDDDATAQKNSNSLGSAVVVTNIHMGKALAESKPSISPKELARFKAIYAEFSSDRNGELPPGEPSNEIGGRVTLQ